MKTMKMLFCALFVLSLAALPGCLITGQIIIVEDIDIGVTTDTNISRYDLDLNVNEDYLDNKDKILSVDAVSLVACIINNGEVVKAQIYFTPNKTNYTTAADIIANAILIFVSPDIGPGKTLIDWDNGLNYVSNEDKVIDEVLGDGTMCFYGIANQTTFDMDMDVQVVVTLTVEK